MDATPSVYETMRVTNGIMPFLDRHIRRFENNASRAGLAAPPDAGRAVIGAVAAAGRADLAVRLSWDGRDLSIELRDVPSCAPMRIITASEPHVGYEVKTTERGMFDRARAEARERGADDALLLTASGMVAEGSLFAVGWFEGEALRVPGLELGILPSIGRERVVELAKQLDIPLEEGAYPRSALNGRAVFAFTATRGVVRIAELDGTIVPNDERIDRLREAFWPPNSPSMNGGADMSVES